MGRSELCGFGTTFDAKHWLSLDPCGLICIACSFALHIFALVAVATTLISHHLLSQLIFALVYAPASALAMASLFVAWTTDPGAVPMGARPLVVPPESPMPDEETLDSSSDGRTPRSSARRRGIRRCRKCNDNYKPPRAHHDSVTGRCIVKMDHYCPWVCNAVGASNHKFFFLFILYTFITALTCFVLLIIRFVRCGNTTDADDNGSDADGDDDAADAPGESASADQSMLFARALDDNEETTYKYPGCDDGLFSSETLILVIVTAVFLFFTCCMLFEQGEAIDKNMSKIARMKMRAGRAGDELRPVAKDFNEMFGGNHPHLAWHWLLPTPVKFPDGSRDEVMGYEWDLTFGDSPYQEPVEVPSGNTDAQLGQRASYDPPLNPKDDDGGGEGVPESSPKEVQLEQPAGLARSDSAVKKRNKQDSDHGPASINPIV